MNFDHRTFNSNYSRPKPFVHFDAKMRSLIVISVWGQPIDPTPLAENLLNYYHSKLKDQDYTSPFGFVDHLDFHENTLRTSALIANNSFFNKYNSEEMVCGLELSVLLQVENALYKLQVGQPHSLLHRNGKTSLLSTEPDLSMECSPKDLTYAPLPNKLFGLSKDVDFHLQKISLQPKDQIVLINRSQIYPFQLSQMSSTKPDLDLWSQHLVDQNSELPFWLGVLDLAS